MSQKLRFEEGLQKTAEFVSLPTKTTRQQQKVEDAVEKCFQQVLRQKDERPGELWPQLQTLLHESCLVDNLFELEPFMTSLDSSKPWLAFWTLHSLSLLDNDGSSVWQRACDMLLGCEDKETGGFGGGPGQMAHLATTYAAINAFATLCKEEAWQKVNRSRLHKFLKSMKQPDGSFTMHLGGEIDVRGVYCAMSVAYLCNIQDPELFENTADWVASCQTYEGGFGPCPGNEAHGGYTFCAVASLVLLNNFVKVDLPSLIRWLVNRQMSFEGGFSGRTNKMVDGCYSFWQGASFPLLHLILYQKYPELTETKNWLFDQEALQTYILCACQSEDGGLRDKPGRSPDSYHTCFCLSGLSLAQHGLSEVKVIGPEENILKPIHPIYNLTIDAVQLAKNVFAEPYVPSTFSSSSTASSSTTSSS